MSETVIGDNSRVTLHFSLALEDGSVIDSNFDDQPASMVIGDGNMLPGFEHAMYGLKAGDREVFQLAPEQGFGQHNPNNVQQFARSDFAGDIELEPGLMLSFADANKGELPGVVVGLDDETVTIDFNHPLAGKNIVFEVEIIEVGTLQ